MRTKKILNDRTNGDRVMYNRHLIFGSLIVLFFSLAYSVEYNRFTPAQTKAIHKQARKAAPLYPQVGGIGYMTDKGALVLEPFRPLLFTPLGACDSNEECHAAADEACRNAGHEGGDDNTTEINEERTLCSEDCSDGSGAVALISCNR